MGKKGKQDLRVHAYVRLVRAAEALHAAVSRELVLEGLTASQFSTMKALKMQGPLAQRDIAKYLLKTGGNVTVVIDNLERQGYVTRIRDTEDRRIVFVRLTPAGEALFDRVYPDHLNRIRATVGPLTDAECETLLDLLEKLSPEVDPFACAPAEAEREVAASLS